jgi:hypothetical protein
MWYKQALVMIIPRHAVFCVMLDTRQRDKNGYQFMEDTEKKNDKNENDGIAKEE